MQHLGEIISLVVALSWTVTALFADKASHRMGSLSTNIIRLVLATFFLAVILWIGVGHPYPVYADGKAWAWLAASALVGYVFGDWCLFNCYVAIGARFGQLFMTLAPPMAAIAGWAILGETLTWKSGLAMAVTLCGIAISILSRGDKVHHSVFGDGMVVDADPDTGTVSVDFGAFGRRRVNPDLLSLL